MFCPYLKGTGIEAQGGHAEYMLMNAEATYLIPDKVSYEQAAPIFCAGYTVYGGLRWADPQPHERVAVLGIGGLGHLALQYARAAGFDDLYLVACQTTGETHPERLGFDAGVEFPPHGHHAIWLNARVDLTNPVFSGLVTSYRALVVQSLSRPRDEFKLFRCVVPAWDNTARRQDKATVFVGSSPEIFEHWVAKMVADTLEKFRGEDRLLFVNAWNEWGEGCHLEPDVRYGRQYLQALRNATTSQHPVATNMGVPLSAAETPTKLPTEHERR